MIVYGLIPLGQFAEADKLLDLDQCLVQLRVVLTKWREIGEALFVPSTYIEQVETYCASSSDAAAGLMEIIDYWIRNCSGQPTWRELADALKSVGEIQLAKELTSVYETGMYDCMNYLLVLNVRQLDWQICPGVVFIRS